MDVEKALEQYGWNGKFFLLTRDHPIEITELGGGFDGGEIDIKGSLFHYANQCLSKRDTSPNDELDEFGRNYLDRMFIALCIQIHVFVVSHIPQMTFRLFTIRKENDKYMARLQYDNVDLEMELLEMAQYFECGKNRNEIQGC